MFEIWLVRLNFSKNKFKMSDFPLNAKLNFQKMLSFILICCFGDHQMLLSITHFENSCAIYFCGNHNTFFGEFLDVFAVTFDKK